MLSLLFNNTKRASKMLLLASLWLCAASASAAMRCRAVDLSNNPVIALATPIKVSTVNLTKGTLIWYSESIRGVVRCDDGDYGLNVIRTGNPIYLYFDPPNVIGSIDPVLDVQIEMLYPFNNSGSVRSGYRLNTGAQIICTPFCDPSETRQAFLGRNIYLGANVNIEFRVVVRVGSGQPPADGKILSGATYQLFKLGGEKDTLSAVNASGNFGASLTGLQNISFISCKPTITVAASSGATVNFGTIPMAGAVAGKIAKQMPFSVNVDMSGPDNGQACPKSTMLATFSTTYPVQGGDTIMPATNSGFGIVLSKATTPATSIPMGQEVNLGLVNGTFVQNKFMAGVKWLNAKPAVGPFKASATVDVTFR